MITVKCVMKREWISGPLRVSYNGNVSVEYGWSYSIDLDVPFETSYPEKVTLKSSRRVKSREVEAPTLLSGPLGIHGDVFSSIFPLKVLKRDPPVMGEAALIA